MQPKDLAAYDKVTPTLLERYDVYELWVVLAPLIAREIQYDDGAWITTLQLAGVQDVAGHRLTDKDSVLFGTLSTHPPMNLRVALRTGSDGLHACTEFGLRVAT